VTDFNFGIFDSAPSFTIALSASDAFHLRMEASDPPRHTEVVPRLESPCMHVMRSSFGTHRRNVLMRVCSLSPYCYLCLG
jgi:hypothetical protein